MPEVEEIEIEDPEAGYVEIDTEDVLPEPDEESEAGADEPEVEPQASEEDSSRGPDQALAAQHRILKRENTILQQRFNQLLEVISRAQEGQGPPQEPEALPDPEEDLAGSLIGRLDRLEQANQQDRQERQAREERQALAGEVQAAQQQVIAYRDTHPEYAPAVEHLVQAVAEEAREEFPTATEAEIQSLLEQETVRRLLQWRRAGLDPGEQLVKLARRRGWQPSQDSSAGQEDPRQQVRAQRRRSRSASTIAAVPGAGGSKRLTVKDAVGMSEEEWSAKLDKVPLRELLRGKQRA